MVRQNGIEIKGITQLDRISVWATDGLEAALMKRRTMQPFINSFGREVEYHFFQSEISPAGRSWQPLSEATEGVRYERGYPTTRPILEQSGQLRNLAAMPFLKWGPNTARSSRKVNAPYGNHHALSMNATNSNGKFRAQISGARVKNQYGGKIPITREQAEGFRMSGLRPPVLPARPFWGLNQEMFEQGFKSFKWILPDEWRKQGVGLNIR